jgi:hypothetical protein
MDVLFKAQIHTQQAAQEYQCSVEFYRQTQENLDAARHQLSQTDQTTWQEYVHHANIQVVNRQRLFLGIIHCFI